MNRVVNILFILIISMLVSGCISAKLNPKQQSYIDNQEVLYTQVGMWAYKSIVYGTNYSTGVFIPINTKVTISKVTTSAIIMNYDGMDISIKNTKHTQVDITTLLDRTLSLSKVNISNFSKKIKSNILNGRLVVGMSKEASILARGYPPAHSTLSLKSNTWRYWNSRWNTTIYEFSNNKIIHIKK